MKRTILAGTAILVVVVAAYFMWPKSGGPAAIIKMAGNSASETEMLNAVHDSSPYSLSADDVIKLKEAKVPNAVIIEMLHKTANRDQTAKNPATHG